MEICPMILLFFCIKLRTDFFKKQLVFFCKEEWLSMNDIVLMTKTKVR